MKFKMGDKVFDIRHGWGTVVEVEFNHSGFPIQVHFSTLNKTISDVYTIDGRSSFSDTYPSLYFVEITIPHNASVRPKWRAEVDEIFFHINSVGFIIRDVDNRYVIDNRLYDIGNYFESEQEAKESDIYKAFHKIKGDDVNV